MITKISEIKKSAGSSEDVKQVLDLASSDLNKAIFQLHGIQKASLSWRDAEKLKEILLSLTNTYQELKSGFRFTKDY